MFFSQKKQRLSLEIFSTGNFKFTVLQGVKPCSLLMNIKMQSKYHTWISIILIFVCPCIVSIIRNWWPTRCNFWFIYLYAISSTCFGRRLRPSSDALDRIYSFWYSPPMLLPSGVMDEMELTGRQQHRWTISEAVNTVKCSWWWAKTSPDICRADWVQIRRSFQKFCTLRLRGQ